MIMYQNHFLFNVSPFKSARDLITPPVYLPKKEALNMSSEQQVAEQIGDMLRKFSFFLWICRAARENFISFWLAQPKAKYFARFCNSFERKCRKNLVKSCKNIANKSKHMLIRNMQTMFVFVLNMNTTASIRFRCGVKSLWKHNFARCR